MTKLLQSEGPIAKPMDKKVSALALSAAEGLPVTPKVKKDRQGWLKFGEKNDFPTRLMNLVGGSPVQSSINRSTVTYIVGKGARPAIKNKYIGQPNPQNNWTELIRLLATDYKISGGFYFQVIVNKGGNSVSLFHHDWTEVRIGEVDEVGTPKSFRVSKDWTKTSGNNKPLEIEVWPGSIKAAQKGKAYMYYYWDYTPGMPHYALPDYYPANKYINADGSLADFYDNSIRNGFIVSTVVSMPTNPPQEQKDEYEQGFRDAFTGPAGVSSVVFIWGESETAKPQITPFQSTTNADVYNDVEGIIFQKIISANRLTSPTLAGISGSGNLSGNAAEIIDAYVLFNATVINESRQTILNILNIFTKMNKLGQLAIDDLDIVAQIEGDSAEKPTQSTADESGNTPTTLKRKSWGDKFKKAVSKLWK